MSDTLAPGQLLSGMNEMLPNEINDEILLRLDVEDRINSCLAAPTLAACQDPNSHVWKQNFKDLSPFLQLPGGVTHRRAALHIFTKIPRQGKLLWTQHDWDQFMELYTSDVELLLERIRTRNFDVRAYTEALSSLQELLKIQILFIDNPIVTKAIVALRNSFITVRTTPAIWDHLAEYYKNDVLEIIKAMYGTYEEVTVALKKSKERRGFIHSSRARNDLRDLLNSLSHVL